MSKEANDSGESHKESTVDPEAAEYPPTLRITSLPAEQVQAAAIERAERWEGGEEIPHVVNFEDRR